jgi:hypothetical protein
VAEPGDRLLIKAGIYRESLQIGTDDLEIVGDGERSEVMLTSVGRKPVITCTAQAAVVRNVSIQHRPVWFTRFGHAVIVVRGSLVVESTDIASEGLSCLLVRGDAAAGVRGCRIHGAVRAIDVNAGALAIVEDNDIFDSGYRMSILHGDGVNVVTGAEAQLSRNRIHDIVGEGIIVGGTATLRHNDLFCISEDGVTVSAKARIDGRGNQIHKCDKSGVRFERGSEGTLEDNDIFANEGAAVTIATEASPVVRRNRFYANGGGSVAVSPGARATTEDNDEREDLTMSDTPRPTGRFKSKRPARTRSVS